MATKSLTEGNHNIQVSLTGYDTLNATINVTSDGVLCVSVAGTGGTCTSTPPGVVCSTPSGVRTVTVYLKETTTGVSSYADWVASKGGAAGLKGNFVAIGEIIDGYLASPGESGYLGFTVTFPNIGTTIDYYLG